jgi:hypothetical protein
MPKLDSYFSLNHAYDYNPNTFTPIESFTEFFTPTNSLRFGGSWNSSIPLPSGPRPPPPPGPPGPRPPPPPPGSPGPRPSDGHHHSHSPYSYYPVPSPYFLIDRPYKYYSDYYPYFNDFSDYFPMFYNMYAYSPYNTTYNQYLPTMNMFWDSVIKSVRNYPINPTKYDIDRMKNFIINLPFFIPCNDSCKSFMKFYIQEQLNNLDAYTQNKNFLIKFFDDLRHTFFIKFENDSTYI